jgi:3-oxoacyl-[acyl-carrier protein] reductase
MDLGLRGRTALVCSASAGMGLACAEVLVEEGANAIMLARRRELLEREAARLGGTAVPGDVSHPADLQRAVDTALATYGALDIVITNGGGPPPGPAADLALSNAVRPGVVGYMKTLATELACEGITVNSIAPGRIATARGAALYAGEPSPEEFAAIPARRLGQPREVGDVVAFLCSSRASYVTGTLLAVDGGLLHGLS